VRFLLFVLIFYGYLQTILIKTNYSASAINALFPVKLRSLKLTCEENILDAAEDFAKCCRRICYRASFSSEGDYMSSAKKPITLTGFSNVVIPLVAPNDN
jgi:hypothetical protein